MEAFTSRVPPLRVVVPAKVPDSERIRFFEEGIDTLVTVKVLVVVVLSMARVALLVIVKVETV